MSRIFLILLLAIASSLLNLRQAYSYQNDYFLMIGSGVGASGFSSPKTESTYSAYGLGVHSHLGYKFKTSEIGFLSHIYFGYSSSVNLEDDRNGAYLKGDGIIDEIAIGPFFKNHFGFKMGENKNIPYWGVSLITSQRTIRFRGFETNYPYSEEYKLSMKAIGAEFRVGFETSSDGKEKSDTKYYEIIYAVSKAFKASVVDKSDYTAVQDVSETDVRDLDMWSSTIIFSIGFTVL